jgi:hypothetical protein
MPHDTSLLATIVLGLVLAACGGASWLARCSFHRLWEISWPVARALSFQ